MKQIENGWIPASAGTTENGRMPKCKKAIDRIGCFKSMEHIELKLKLQNHGG